MCSDNHTLMYTLISCSRVQNNSQESILAIRTQARCITHWLTDSTSDEGHIPTKIYVCKALYYYFKHCTASTQPPMQYESHCICDLLLAFLSSSWRLFQLTKQHKHWWLSPVSYICTSSIHVCSHEAQAHCRAQWRLHKLTTASSASTQVARCSCLDLFCGQHTRCTHNHRHW